MDSTVSFVGSSDTGSRSCARKRSRSTATGTLLIAQALDERGVEVAHIHAGGELETHGEAMDRLLERFNLRPEGELFLTRKALIAEAVERQARRVAFVDENPAKTSTGAIQ